MRYTDDHEAWEMKPRKLSIEELEHPERVVDEFFQFAQLPQVRWYMWELMKTLVTDGYSRLRCREKSSLIYFYEQVEKMIEVIHVLHEKNYYRPLQESEINNDVCSRLE